jgi:hypothetical protein
MALTEQEELELLELEREEAMARMPSEAGPTSAREMASTPVAPPPTRLPGQVSGIEAFGRGTLAGVTSDFDEELGAAFQAGLEAARRRIEKSQTGRTALEALGFGVTPTQTMAGGETYTPEQEDLTKFYQEGREMGRLEKERAQASAPKAYLGGQVVGAVGQAALAGAAGVPVASLGGAVGMSAAQGLGASEADLTQGAVGEAALDTATGAALGAAAYGLGKGLEKAAPVVGRQLAKAAERVGLDEVAQAAKTKIDDALRQFAAMRAVKATGAIQSDINKESEKQILKKGQTLLEEGLIPWSGNKAVIEQNALKAQQLAGEAMEDILRTADAEMFVNRFDVAAKGAKEFDWGRVLSRINTEVRAKLGATGQRVSGASLRSGVGEFAPSLFDDIAKTASEGGGFVAANRLKSEIADGAYSTLANKLQNRVAKQVERTLNDEIEKQLKEIAGEKIASEFTRAKNIYGATKLAQKGLKRAAAQQGNNLFGLSEMLAGPSLAGISAVVGAEPLGIATSGAVGALATKLAKDRGSAVLARGAQALRQAPGAITQAAQAAQRRVPAQALQRTLSQQPALFGKYAQILQQAAQQGEQQLAVTDYTLANQSEEYRKMREELMKAENE